MRHPPALAVALVPLLLAAPGGAARAGARSMEWSALETSARLDAAGDLHVRERQVIVFDGDWNGGERRFRLGAGQGLVFERLVREPPGGPAVVLSRGDLSRVDRWQLVDATTLRWRSRAPGDPPFARATLVYVLEYTLTGVLSRDAAGSWSFSHDFAFPEREWPIRYARGTLELDPAWRAEAAGPLEVTSGGLAPGESLRLDAGLRWRGAGPEPTPGAGPGGAAAPARHPALPLVGLATLAVALASALALAGRTLVGHARARGQLSPGPALAEVDLVFLREHVLSEPPEVIGAAWDDAVGAPEVAAVLARMQSEGKLRSRVERRGWWLLASNVLHLELLVDRAALEGYERDLVSALFVDGDTIDSVRLREHYRKRGFDPASRLRRPLARRVRFLASVAEGPPPWIPLGGAGALGAAALLLAVSGAAHEPGAVRGASVVLVVAPALATALAAAVLRGRADRALLPLVVVLALPGAWAAAVVWVATGAARASPITLLGHALACLCGMLLAVAIGRTPRSADDVALRKRLAAARAWLARELRSPSPRLDDTWTPYLLAFGLGDDVDRWFRAHAAEDALAVGSSSGASGAARARWTGGGGGFSGGGASGTWAALGSLASGVPAPGSSSSSGSRSGGGGGGGRSGGGGGGGW